jgi:hypothetical protein
MEVGQIVGESKNGKANFILQIKEVNWLEITKLITVSFMKL